MTIASLQQSTAPAPPIPALPQRPGAITGSQTAPPAAVAGQGSITPGGNPSVRDQIRAEIQNGIREGIRAGDEARQAGTTETGYIYDPNNVIPPQVVPLTGMALAMIAVIFVGWPIARALSRRMDRRTELGAVNAAELQPQIRQLQESVDAMAVELERIGEAQRFTAKLMSERAAALPALDRPRA